ncbi:MAG: hypothetical protein IPH35_17715 [Rhodoferax sp.]|nr:hypothetical protein [Rhodoferax sp.]
MPTMQEEIKQERSFQDYKSNVKPIWCPGCGDFAVLQAILKAFTELGLDPEKTAVVSGIGCSSRIPAYTNVYGFHGVHGRALPIATGLKIARPDLTVVVTGGDGDGFSIGGNHFMHACRRNVDMTYIVMDNQVYGMTKGQASPTTAPDWSGSKLTPGGTGINPFLPLGIALSSGANYIARTFAGDTNFTARVITEAILHPGFSFVQILSPCVTYRPEQREWRNLTHASETEYATDPSEAGRRLLADDGLTLGVLYKGSRAVFQPDITPTSSVTDLDSGFHLPHQRQPQSLHHHRATRKGINSVEELLAHSIDMEKEAQEAYNELADQMDVHNNQEVAELFRKMAVIEGKHVDQVTAKGEGLTLPHIAPWEYRWEIAGFKEAPEAISPTDTHYLMTPYHAVSLAIRYEQRAVDFYAKVAESTADPAVKKMALEMCEEEKEHVSLLKARLARYPAPKEGWDEDMDPPTVQE